MNSHSEEQRELLVTIIAASIRQAVAAHLPDPVGIGGFKATLDLVKSAALIALTAARDKDFLALSDELLVDMSTDGALARESAKSFAKEPSFQDTYRVWKETALEEMRGAH